MKRTPRESSFAVKVWARLDEIPNAWFVTIQQKSIRGVPDIIGCINGYFVALELKRTKSEAQKNSGRIVLQRHIVNKIIESGGAAYFVHPENLNDVINYLMALSNSDEPQPLQLGPVQKKEQ